MVKYQTSIVFPPSCSFDRSFSNILIYLFAFPLVTDSQQARRINRNEVNDDIPRRAQIARNQRRHVPQQAAQEESGDSDGDESRPSPFAEGAKMGTKKRAKLEAKAEKRQHREQELIAREEKKKKDALVEAERKKTEQAQEVQFPAHLSGLSDKPRSCTD